MDCHRWAGGVPLMFSFLFLSGLSGCLWGNRVGVFFRLVVAWSFRGMNCGGAVFQFGVRLCVLEVCILCVWGFGW